MLESNRWKLGLIAEALNEAARLEVGHGARLVRDDVVAEVARLKARPGYDMGVGGPTIAAALLRAGLVDDVRVYVQPVVLGAGLPFLPPLEGRIGLELLETRTFASGVVFLHYRTVPTTA